MAPRIPAALRAQVYRETGAKGGKATAKKRTAEQRSEAARVAAVARWGKRDRQRLFGAAAGGGKTDTLRRATDSAMEARIDISRFLDGTWERLRKGKS